MFFNMPLLKNFIFAIIFAVFTTLWVSCFIYLGLHIQEIKPTTALLVLGSISFIALIYWIRVVYQNQHFKRLISTLNLAQASVAPHIETIIFDGNGRVITSSHPNTYPTMLEFTRKLLSRINDPEVAQKIQKMIEERQRGEILFASGGNGLGQDEKWWILNLSTFDRNCFLVILRDVTHHFEAYSQLKTSYKQLQQFIDKAPFGIFYTNSNGIILGLNETLCQWLEIERQDLIGRPMTDFIKDSDSYRGTVRIFNKNGPTFRAILFKPDESPSKARPSILCKLDQATSIAQGDVIQDSAYLDAPIPAVMLSQSGDIISSNPAFITMLGDIPSRNKFEDLIPQNIRSDIKDKLKTIFDQKSSPSPFEIRFEGERLQSTAYPSKPIVRGNQKEIMLQFIDNSEQKRLHGQFIQSQKMQAVGQLAGGIAHDFNNLLTAMIGYCDLLLQRYIPNDPSYNDVVQIKQNANRAANLVRQLLAFSRQQTLQPKVVNITDNLVELSTLLRRLIGAGIELKMSHARDLWPIKVDVSQLEQVIINLAVNARDAMNEGGILTIRTSNIEYVKQQRVGHDVIPKGDYVMLEVSDTGHGIPDEHLNYIFEPFFSTKEVGEGTGLGLSTVYGIVKQTGGFVLVESKVGKGTTFKILLPHHQGNIEIEIQKQEVILQDLTGGGRVLLVEDEDAVRMFSARALREKGYTVIEASNGEAALNMVQNGEKFDILITDVVMPKMDGPTLSKRIRDIYPDAKTIFISGYTEDTFRKNLDYDTKIHFLPKPYTLKDLASKVKEIMNPPAINI